MDLASYILQSQDEIPQSWAYLLYAKAQNYENFMDFERKATKYSS